MYGTPGKFGYKPLTSFMTHSGMISCRLFFDTQATLGSSRAAACFFAKYLSSLHDPSSESKLQKLLSLFLMRLLPPCGGLPAPSQCCLYVVVHGVQKQYGHSAHRAAVQVQADLGSFLECRIWVVCLD